MCPLTSHLVNIVPLVDIRKLVGFTVYAKAIHVTAEYEFNRLYVSQKKVKTVEGVVISVDLQITKQRRDQFYVIADYKNPDGIFKRTRLNSKSVVAGPFLVPVPFNLPSTANLLTATTTNTVPVTPSTSIIADNSTPVDPVPLPKTTTTNVAPAILPTTTTVTANCPNIFAPKH